MLSQESYRKSMSKSRKSRFSLGHHHYHCLFATLFQCLLQHMSFLYKSSALSCSFIYVCPLSISCSVLLFYICLSLKNILLCPALYKFALSYLVIVYFAGRSPTVVLTSKREYMRTSETIIGASEE